MLAEAPADAPVLADETVRELRAAVSALSERCRTLLALLLTEPPLAYDEIGEILDMPVGSIGPTRGRCLDSIRDSLDG